VAFGREMHHEIEVVATKQRLNQPGIADIAMNELEPFISLYCIEIGSIARISERIEHDNQIVRMQPTPIKSEVGADETRAAGDQESRDQPR
jgi:hypothetical protein